MTHSWARRFLAVLLVCFVGLAGCSSAPVELSGDSGPTSATVASDEPAPTSTPDAPTTEPAPTSTPTAEAPAPLRAAGEPLPTTDADVPSTSAYISRVSMSSAGIEVGWSDKEQGAEYHIHRVPRTSDEQPGAEAMMAENLVHIGDGMGRFLDEGVEAGTPYWHGIRVLSADGALIAHGYHRTAAVDDEEPPSVVAGITAVFEDGEVLVTWERPDENYELHAYRVLRGADGETPEQIGQTWQLDQVSFIDDEPPISDQVVYQIVAMDFHWNLSDPGSVTIDLS